MKHCHKVSDCWYTYNRSGMLKKVVITSTNLLIWQGYRIRMYCKQDYEKQYKVLPPFFIPILEKGGSGSETNTVSEGRCSLHLCLSSEKALLLLMVIMLGSCAVAILGR